MDINRVAGVLPCWNRIFCIGMLGEYLGKAYAEVNPWPRYLIEKTVSAHTNEALPVAKVKSEVGFMGLSHVPAKIGFDGTTAARPYPIRGGWHSQHIGWAFRDLLPKWFVGAGDALPNACGYAIGLTVSFMLNRNWKFRHTDAALPAAL